MRVKKSLTFAIALVSGLSLGAACAGGAGAGSDSGEGGTDGSGGRTTASGGRGGGETGGLGGEGGGVTVVQPETCSDGKKNEDETDVDCGGPDCDPCADEAECSESTDCVSSVCDDGTCAAPACGDGVKNGDEECDDSGDTADCNEDCTLPECGDGYVNEEAGEECEPDPDKDVWQRCGRTCIYGVDLDGTWRTTNVLGTNSPWERLRVRDFNYYYSGLQSFHYVGQPAIYDMTDNQVYDIGADTWTDLTGVLPYDDGDNWFTNGAVDSKAIWVPRNSNMFRFDLGTRSWSSVAPDIPDGGYDFGTRGGAAVYDGDGFIWYIGTVDPGGVAHKEVLVRFDPADGSFLTFSWATDFPTYAAYEARVAYDPLSHSIVWGSYGLESTFLKFDIAEEAFSETSALPDGSVITDTACQDRAGGVYLIGDEETAIMYRYDIAADEYTALPPLPASHDFTSTCVVSEVGYLYYGTNDGDPVFARLRLNGH